MSLKLRLMSLYFSQQAANSLNRRPVSAVVGPLLVVLVTLIWGVGLVAGFDTSLWLFVGLGFLLAVLGLLQPVLGLLGVGILVALEPVTRVYLPEVGFYRWNTLIYWLLLIIVLNLPTLLRFNDVSTRLLQVFVLLMGLEIIYSTDQVKGVQMLLEISTIFALMVCVLRVVNEKRVFYWLGVVIGLLGALGGLVFNVEFGQLSYLNPNAWAFFPATALMMICLGFYDLSREGNGLGRKALLLMALFTVNFAWVFISGSRGNMLTGLLCLLYILWLFRSRPGLVIALVLVAMLGYWITTQLQNQSSEALSRIELLFSNSDSLARRTSGRSMLWEGGIKIFINHPLGVGTGSFNDNYAEIDPWGRARPSHSAWVATLAENGIPGIVLLVSYVLSFAVIGWIKRKEPGLLPLSLLLTALLASIFVTKEIYVRGLWLLVAVVTIQLNEPAMQRILALNDPRRVLWRFSHLRDAWVTPEPQSGIIPVIEPPSPDTLPEKAEEDGMDHSRLPEGEPARAEKAARLRHSHSA